MLYLYMKNGILTAATYVQKGAWERRRRQHTSLLPRLRTMT